MIPAVGRVESEEVPVVFGSVDMGLQKVKELVVATAVPVVITATFIRAAIAVFVRVSIVPTEFAILDGKFAEPFSAASNFRCLSASS